jgi:hypothetical protein
MMMNKRGRIQYQDKAPSLKTGDLFLNNSLTDCPIVSFPGCTCRLMPTTGGFKIAVKGKELKEI